MPLHYIAWKQALGEWGCTFDEELFYSWGGKPARRNHRHAEPDARASKCPSKPSPSAKRTSTIRLASATQAGSGGARAHRRPAGPHSLCRGLRQQPRIGHQIAHRRRTARRFDILVGSEDYARSKPAPDAFLIAAARLGVAPKDCLVFEDTEMGIQAATAAGMASVRVPRPLRAAMEPRRACVESRQPFMLTLNSYQSRVS